MNQPLHARAKALRETAGLSLSQAASVVGVSKQHLWGFEQGRTTNPSLSFVCGLAHCYGLTISELLNGEGKLKIGSETMAAMVAIDAAIKAAYRRGFADGKASRADD